ncbi:hypothetical protein E2C01_100819 [Portunus trituberculatus]|uniref:Uncharacterized protein n=1 Tax=Portunus trituberculatus TaxID=210409 RepID=A0A5B7KEA9_PORTR|nr:hypothetical protein [Portunus trituberculatus]
MSHRGCGTEVATQPTARSRRGDPHTPSQPLPYPRNPAHYPQASVPPPCLHGTYNCGVVTPQ